MKGTPIVIAVEAERVWDTTHVTIIYSDKSKKEIEIEEGASKGEEIKIVDHGAIK